MDEANNRTYMCQAINDTKVVDLLAGTVVLVCGLETTIVRVEVEVLLRVLQLIWHPGVGLFHGHWLLGLD